MLKSRSFPWVRIPKMQASGERSSGTFGAVVNPSAKPGVLWLGNQLSQISNTRAVSEDIVEQLQKWDWRVASASGKQNQFLRLADMVATALRKKREYEVGVIDVYSGKAFMFAEFLSAVLQRLGKKLVLVLHGGGLIEFQEKFPNRIKRLLGKADLVVSPSKRLIQGLSLVCPDVHYIPNGIDLSRYEFRCRERPEPRLGWLRAFHRIYNPMMAIETLALLRKDFPHANLRMVGPDKGDGSGAAVRARVHQLGLENVLTLGGAVAKASVPTELNTSDIFLNTTNYESFGVAVLEAAACGLCIVSTNVGELGLSWSHGVDALLVEKGDWEEMARQVGRILRDTQLAGRLSQNGRARAQHFSWDEIIPSWEKKLAEVCSKDGVRKGIT